MVGRLSLLGWTGSWGWLRSKIEVCVCVIYELGKKKEFVRYQKVLKEEHEKTFIPDFHKKSH